MALRNNHLLALVLTAAVTASGCATGSGFSFPVPSWLGGTGQPTPAATAKKNADISKAQAAAQHKEMNKQFGVKEDANFFQKAGTSMSVAYHSTTDKVAGWIGQKKPEAQTVDAVSLKTPANASAETYVIAARMQERKGNLDDAIIKYQKALEIEPKHLSAQVGLARLYDRQGKFDEAVKIYHQALCNVPSEAGTWNDLGLCEARRGNLEDSAKALRKATDLQPDRVLYRNNLAKVLVELNRAPEAVAQLQAVHGKAVAHYNIGYLLQERGQSAAALQEFQQAVAADPNMEQAAQWVAQLSGASAAGLAANGTSGANKNQTVLSVPAVAAGTTTTEPRVAARPNAGAPIAPPLQQPAGIQPLPAAQQPVTAPGVQTQLLPPAQPTAPVQPTIIRPVGPAQPAAPTQPAATAPQARLPLSVESLPPPVAVPSNQVQMLPPVGSGS
ncbi:MAG: tetratricopeptide repeat protein [Planctomycetes bacterium]|nr:tetratricopeptide repeat protein [Planctomycetota bacterium]